MEHRMAQQGSSLSAAKAGLSAAKAGLRPRNLPAERPGNIPCGVVDILRRRPAFQAMREEIARTRLMEPEHITRRRALRAWLYLNLFLRPTPSFWRINVAPLVPRLLDLKPVELRSTDGLRLSGLYRPGTDPGRVVVVQHGRAIRKELMLLHVKALPREWSVLCFDFRGHGASEAADSTLGYHEQRDLAGALDWLAERGAERFALWGVSMGAVTSLMYAPRDPRVAAVVSEAGYASMRDVLMNAGTQRHVEPWPFVPIAKHFFDQRLGFDMDQVNPEESVRGWGKPLLQVHGRQDTTVLPEHGERIVAAAGPPARLLLVDGGHGALIWKQGKVYGQAVRDFLGEHLYGQAAPSPDSPTPKKKE